MARLTNRQLDALAGRVTDLLEEAHNEQVKHVVESKEYKTFLDTYTDYNIATLKQLHDEFSDLDNEREKLINKIHVSTNNILGYGINASYGKQRILDGIQRYKEDRKREKYPNTTFERDKILRKVEADILLSDITNPEELIKSLVEKLK